MPYAQCCGPRNVRGPDCNNNVNFECISVAKRIINSFDDKLIVTCIHMLVSKSQTTVVPIANTCSIGYPHDGRADNAAYRHDRRADKRRYRHDRRADSLSRFFMPRDIFRKCFKCTSTAEITLLKY